MESIVRLNEAFQNFTEASKSLESYYVQLNEKVAVLTGELAAKNSQLADALNTAEEVKDYLAGVLQSLREAIIVLAPDRRVTMMNTAAAELIGRRPESCIGMPYASLGIALAEEGAGTVLTAGGRRYTVIVSSSAVCDAEGRVRGHVILFQDISRLKELEEQQERNHRLIAMGEMAAKIVHEIRSPLCSIELYATMLAKDLEGTAHLDLASGISGGIRSLNNILTNMLLFAKPQRPAFKKISPAAVITDSLSLLVPMLGARRLTIDAALDESAGIDGDAELLKQAFLNVIINAIQASPDDATIRIRLTAEGATVTAAITDAGAGIAAADLERIFDPFFSTKEKGTGLGLSIAAKIVQAHGGSIRALSEGAGSMFLLRFPTAEVVQGTSSVKEVFQI